MPTTRGLLGTMMLAAMVACSRDSPANIEDSGALQVTLINLAPAELAVHILGPGEAYHGSNRLDPGQSRVISILARNLERIPFRVGRNGVDLEGKAVECVVQYNSIDEPPSDVQVVWSEGDNLLSCVSWLARNP